jgi:hypothetical protein
MATFTLSTSSWSQLKDFLSNNLEDLREIEIDRDDYTKQAKDLYASHFRLKQAGIEWSKDNYGLELDWLQYKQLKLEIKILVKIISIDEPSPNQKDADYIKELYEKLTENYGEYLEVYNQSLKINYRTEGDYMKRCEKAQDNLKELKKIIDYVIAKLEGRVEAEEDDEDEEDEWDVVGDDYNGLSADLCYFTIEGYIRTYCGMVSAVCPRRRGMKWTSQSVNGNVLPLFYSTARAHAECVDELPRTADGIRRFHFKNIENILSEELIKKRDEVFNFVKVSDFLEEEYFIVGHNKCRKEKESANVWIVDEDAPYHQKYLATLNKDMELITIDDIIKMAGSPRCIDGVNHYSYIKEGEHFGAEQVRADPKFCELRDLWREMVDAARGNGISLSELIGRIEDARVLTEAGVSPADAARAAAAWIGVN